MRPTAEKKVYVECDWGTPYTTLVYPSALHHYYNIGCTPPHGAEFIAWRFYTLDPTHMPTTDSWNPLSGTYAYTQRHYKYNDDPAFRQPVNLPSWAYEAEILPALQDVYIVNPVYDADVPIRCDVWFWRDPNREYIDCDWDTPARVGHYTDLRFILRDAWGSYPDDGWVDVPKGAEFGHFGVMSDDGTIFAGGTPYVWADFGGHTTMLFRPFVGTTPSAGWPSYGATNAFHHVVPLYLPGVSRTAVENPAYQDNGHPVPGTAKWWFWRQRR